MTTILLVLLIVSLFVIVVAVAIAICKAGAMDDFQRAYLWCKNCKNYVRQDKKYRLIGCMGIWKTADECLGCREREI